MGLLTPAQFGDFIEVLLDAYPVRLQLAQMLTTRLGRSLDAISVTGSLEGDAFQLIQTAEAQGWTIKLINAARESRPGNPNVIAFAQQFHLVSTNKRKPELELIIRESNGFLDVAAWRSALGEAEMRVCRIEVLRNSGASSFGTGFLVGPSLVMTNYHVIKPVLDEDAKAKDVVLRFDFKRLEDGVTLNSGTVYRLDTPEEEAGWLAACSPYSQVDLGEGQPGELPQPDELDLALLKVDGKPGNDRVGQVM